MTAPAAPDADWVCPTRVGMHRKDALACGRDVRGPGDRLDAPFRFMHRFRMPGVDGRIAEGAAEPEFRPASERALAAVAAALAGAEYPALDRGLLAALRRAIAGGADPLGDAFLRLRPPEARRSRGAVWTPFPIVDAMVRWAAAGPAPARIVDPGAGSGRFLLAAGAAFPRAALVAVENDPLAAALLRANAAARGMAGRLAVIAADYRAAALPEARGATLFLGNPPYVRHHGIAPEWKNWLAESAAALGLKASKLAGLHVHFLLRTLQLARRGDRGAFILPAEWLDTNYGALPRALLAGGLGGEAVHAIAPEAMPFPGAAATGAIVCFRPGRRAGGAAFRRVASLAGLGALPAGRKVPRARLAAARRWSPFLDPPARRPPGHAELGEVCRVHRGQVTGCNAAWIAGDRAGALPASVLAPSVTRARELFAAAPRLLRADSLRRVVDLPPDLDAFSGGDRRSIEDFLAWARRMGADDSYVARHRRAWWSVGLRPPAPILCTYMARRAPAFVRNACGARHINIAHGLYPRDPLPAPLLDALSAWLQGAVRRSSGRAYAGGLTKFEPGEIERLPVPPLEELCERRAAAAL